MIMTWPIGAQIFWTRSQTMATSKKPIRHPDCSCWRTSSRAWACMHYIFSHLGQDGVYLLDTEYYTQDAIIIVSSLMRLGPLSNLSLFVFHMSTLAARVCVCVQSCQAIKWLRRTPTTRSPPPGLLDVQLYFFNQKFHILLAWSKAKQPCGGRDLIQKVRSRFFLHNFF